MARLCIIVYCYFCLNASNSVSSRNLVNKDDPITTKWNIIVLDSAAEAQPNEKDTEIYSIFRNEPLLDYLSHVDLTCSVNFVQNSNSEQELNTNVERNRFSVVQDGPSNQLMFICSKGPDIYQYIKGSYILKSLENICELSIRDHTNSCGFSAIMEKCFSRLSDYKTDVKVEIDTQSTVAEYTVDDRLNYSSVLENTSILVTFNNISELLDLNEPITGFICNASASNDEISSVLHQIAIKKERGPKRKPVSNDENPSLRKCCPEGFLYDVLEHQCAPVEDSQEWSPVLYNETTFQPTQQRLNVSVVYGFPLCKDYLHLENDDKVENDIYIFDNGQMYSGKYGETYPNTDYCMDYFKYENETKEESLVCFPSTSKMNRSMCEKIHSWCIPVFMILSSIFLTLTFLVYASLPDLYSKINGKCVMASTSSLALAFTCLIIMEWDVKHITLTSCQCLGICTQFFSLASFFWLNVMCFDLWKTLRSQIRVSTSTVHSANMKFLKYSIYAWGIPLLISIVTGCMQFLVPANADGSPLTPGIGVTGCFFPKNDMRPSWAYFYGFILILMAANAFLFLHLMILLHRQTLQNESVLQRKDKQRTNWVKLYLKLFCVMGVMWLFEIGSWIGGSCKIWIWTDSLNALRGVFIFAIFVCKKNVILKLKKRFFTLPKISVAPPDFSILSRISSKLTQSRVSAEGSAAKGTSRQTSTPDFSTNL